MEEYTSFPCFIVIVRKQSLVPSDLLVWGSLRLAPIIVFTEVFTAGRQSMYLLFIIMDNPFTFPSGPCITYILSVQVMHSHCLLSYIFTHFDSLLWGSILV